MLEKDTLSIPTILNKRTIFAPFVILIFLSLIAQFTSLDTVIANKFYDSANNSWIGTNSWWAKTLIHKWGRDMIALVFISAFVAVISSFFIPHKLKKYRKLAIYLCLGIVLTTSLVGLGKRYSNVDCPRDLIQYGGNQPYIHVFSVKPSNLASGQCFPGGHSSGAFSLFTLYFIFLFLLPHHARKVLITVSLLGVVYALGQWARGSHFIIHDIWSAVIAWYVSLGLFQLMFHQRWNTEIVINESD